jgi:predicted house-cleaning NTP pyrophosphatase (Maf/HAM1 superfamily)
MKNTIILYSSSHLRQHIFEDIAIQKCHTGDRADRTD